VLGARTVAAGAHAAATITKASGAAAVLPMDVREAASIHAAAHGFARIADHRDVLVNNAGIYPDQDISILTVSQGQPIATFQTNTVGPVLVMQAFLPVLRQAPQARVLNVSSGYGQLSGLSPAVPPTVCRSSRSAWFPNPQYPAAGLVSYREPQPKSRDARIV
jgi:NAD(P)-dependent dehydrogenase (short-subunit alcohol dehydrogenase family)